MILKSLYKTCLGGIMQARTARINAKLAEPNQDINNSEFIEMINNQIKPPEKLS